MTDDRRLALATLVGGLLVIAAAQLLDPAAATPLYDGVVPLEPYVWADPPPDHPGGAQGASATVDVTRGRNALVALATPELVPQAQVLAIPGSLTLPRGASSIQVSITPLGVSVTPGAGYIDGNVYRILLVDQAGNAITADPAQRVSIVLRSADPTLEDASIDRFDGQRWQPLATSPPGMVGGGFVAIVTEFGDFAVVASGVSPYPTMAASAGPSASGRPATMDPARSGSATSRPPGVPGTGAGDGPTGLPWLPIATTALAVVALLILATGILRRRRRRPYRGARPGPRR